MNQASAEDVALDIKDTQAEIEQLEQLVNQQGVISSPFSDVISNVEAEVGTESTQTFCTIYDTSRDIFLLANSLLLRPVIVKPDYLLL